MQLCFGDGLGVIFLLSLTIFQLFFKNHAFVFHLKGYKIKAKGKVIQIEPRSSLSWNFQVYCISVQNNARGPGPLWAPANVWGWAAKSGGSTVLGMQHGRQTRAMEAWRRGAGEGQGAGLPQEDARAAPVRLQQRGGAYPANCTASVMTWPTKCWMTLSSDKALKTFPTGPPSHKHISMESLWGAVMFFRRCARMRTWWQNWESWGSTPPF